MPEQEVINLATIQNRKLLLVTKRDVNILPGGKREQRERAIMSACVENLRKNYQG